MFSNFLSVIMNLIEAVTAPTWDPSRAEKDAQALERLAQTAPDFHYEYPSETEDGRFVPVGWGGGRAPEQPGLSSQDIKEVAAMYELPVAHVRAVVDVESLGSGFLLSEPHPCRPKILFEGHKFYKNSGRVPVSASRPDLSYRRWTKRYYKGGSREWDERLKDAMTFHEEGALMSASWGLGQVLGENYKLAGCVNIQQFIVENFESEKQQLRHMMEFCKNTGLMSALRAGRWKTFARGYNGPKYYVHNYHGRLAAAARKYR